MYIVLGSSPGFIMTMSWVTSAVSGHTKVLFSYLVIYPQYVLSNTF